MLQRRSTAVQGFVRFPVKSKRWKNTNEGGTFVRLVVSHEESPFVCCGGSQYIIYDECFITNDRSIDIPGPIDYSKQLGIDAFKSPLEDEHFPRIHKNCPKCNEQPQCSNCGGHRVEKYLSKPYEAIITIGSTGWSGWSEEEHRVWNCTEKDLTPKGKELMALMRRLFPKGDILLQTWLDT